MDECPCPDAEPGIEPEERSIPRQLRPTRRSVLAGSSVLILAGGVHAAEQVTEHYQLEFADDTHRQILNLRNLSVAGDQDPIVLSWNRRDFGPLASFSIHRESQRYPSRPIVERNDDAAVAVTWLPTLLRVTVHRATFPGLETSAFDAVFTFRRKTPTDTWKVSAGLQAGWFPGASATNSAALPLAEFLAAYNPTKLRFPLQRRDNNKMLWELFGDRVETNADLVLEFGRQAAWTILSLANATAPGLYILDFPLEFGRIDLYRIRGDSPGSIAGTATPGSTGGKVSDVGTGGTDTLRLDPEVKWGALPPRGAPTPVADGCYGVVGDILGFTFQDLARRDRIPGTRVELAAATIGDERIAPVLTLDLKTIGMGEGPEPRTLGAVLRHWGAPAHTAASCFVDPDEHGRPIAHLELRRGPTTSPTGVEGPFSIAGFEIVRQLRRGTGVVTRVALIPASKEVLAETSVGGLVLAALPRSSPEPGKAPRIAPLEVEAVDAPDDRGRRILTRFEARMALFSASVALPERIEPGAGPERVARVVPGTHSWRLDFDQADALLYLPALGSPPVTSADAIVPLGPVPAADPAAAVDRNGPRRRTLAQIALDRACLNVLRPSDLLALKFRFAGLALEVPWPPDAGLPGTLVPHGGRSAVRPRPDVGGRRTTPRDDRPVLVVEFPPQHVAERAYERQLPAPVDMPVLAVRGGDAERFRALREALSRPKRWTRAPTDPLQACRDDPEQSGFKTIADKILSRMRPPMAESDGTDMCERVALREALRDLAKESFDNLLFGSVTVAHFDRRFTEAARKVPRPGGGFAALPDDQQLYAGADFLDPDARQIAIRVLRKLQQEAGATPGSGPDTKLPDAQLDPSEQDAILQSFVDRRIMPGVTDPKALLARLESADDTAVEREFPVLKVLIEEIEIAKERRDVTYAEFRRHYATLAAGLPERFRQYRGREWFGRIPDTEPWTTVKKKVRAEVDRGDGEDSREPFDAVTPARLSGPSRIAFRVDTDDFEADRTGGRIPFTVEGLTNWGGMDMAVVRRAERLMEPLAPGRSPKRWERRALNDEGAILRFQGFSPNRRWGGTGPRTQWAPSLTGPSPAQRLAEVHASSEQPPDVFETALELPYRLFLSPSQDATWKTSAARVAREVFGLPEPDSLAAQIAPFQELWTARLAGSGEQAGLRAVWSPDFRPDALLSTAAPGAPQRGPIPPWALARSVGIRRPGDLPDLTFRTGLDAYDRHELVALTALHGLPVLGRRAAKGDLTAEAGQIEPPEGFALPGLQIRNVPALGGEVELSAIYRPKAFSVSELSLSALGGCLDVDTAFQPPASARDARGSNLFDALSVERWRQRTVLGRDVVVEVVYKGFLFPIGHRASLVKLTERRFVQTHAGGPPVAVLIQRLFLRVGNPVKNFPAEGQPNLGRRWPCERITILTRQTPDLVDPDSELAGLIKFGTDTTGRCFWPRTARRQGAEVWFQMRVGGESVPVRLPLIFVDNSAANDQPTMKALVEHYNRSVADGLRDSPTRKLERNGQPVVMAPEYKPGDTSYETRWWKLAAEGRENMPPKGRPTEARTFDNSLFERDEFMEGLDQPPFYPVVESGSCRIGPIERLTGRSPLWAEVAFDGDYVADGFGDDPEIAAGSAEERGSRHEIYLRILANQQNGAKALPLTFGDRGDQGGGVARGEMEVVGISRQFGPVNGPGVRSADEGKPENGPSADAPQPSLPRSFKPEDAFSSDAKLLGIASLKDLVKAATEVANKLGHHPRLAEALDYGAASVKEGAAEVRAVLTDALIKPAEIALSAAEASWTDLASKRLGTDKVPTLGAAYPQIGQDLAILKLKLVEAQDAKRSGAEFFASLAPIHEAARRLIRTIERITADPLAAASGAQVELFRKITNAITELKALVETLGKVKDWPRRITERFEARLFTALHGRLIKFVDASLPAADVARAVQIIAEAAKNSRPAALSPAELGLLPGRFASQLRAELEAAAPAPSDAVESALTGLIDRLWRLQDDVEAVKAEAERTKELARQLAADATLEISKSLDQAAERAQQRVREAEDAVAAILFSPPVARIVRVMSDGRTVWAAFEAGPTTPKAVAEAFGKALPPLLAILGEIGIARGVEAQAAALCGSVTDALRAGVDVVLPSAGLPELSAACHNALSRGELPNSCPDAGLVTTLFDLSADLKRRTESLGFSQEFKSLQASLVAAMVSLAALGEARRALGTTLPAGGLAACALPGPDVALVLRQVGLRQAQVLDALRRVADEGCALAERFVVRTPEQASREMLQAALRLAAHAIDQIPVVTLLGLAEAAFTELSRKISAVALLVPQNSDSSAALNVLAETVASAPAKIVEHRNLLRTSTGKLRQIADGAAAATSASLAEAVAAARRDAQQRSCSLPTKS